MIFPGKIFYSGGVMELLTDTSVKPDLEGFLNVVTKKREPDRVYFIELFLDDEVKAAVSSKYGLDEKIDPGDKFGELKRDILVHRFLGYEVFRISVIRKDFFPMRFVETADTTQYVEQSRGRREWTEEHRGPIQSIEDFEKYPWPSVDEIDLSPFEWLEKNLPEDMGVYDLTAHILEMLSFLLGYETMCYKMVDEPELIDLVLDKIGEFYVKYTEVMCDFNCVPIVWGSDDMGFKTSTLVSPDFLREKILPWHKKCADVAHAKGRPYFLHSCGNLEEIMDDLIDWVGIDAKHSFEDAIMPVEEYFKAYGHRVSVLGGLDVDFLCRADELSIRKKVREILDVCMNGRKFLKKYKPGGYCFGTGNTVANYIPLENYLIILDEARKFM